MIEGGGGVSGDEEELVPLDEAARRLGLHYMTVYRYVRLGRLPAEQRGGRWWIKPADLVSLAEAAPSPPGRGSRPQRWTDPRQRLVQRLQRGDGPACWAIVEQALARGASPTDVYLRLLAPSMAEIGERWAAGSCSVEAEHRASAVALRIVGRLGPRFARRGTPIGGTILLGGAPGDPHLLPLAMLADILRSSRLNVVDLGADVPVESFLEAVGVIDDLRAVGISLSDADLAREAARAIAALRRARPSLRLLAGGPALPDREGALALGADDWAADALGAARLLGGHG